MGDFYDPRLTALSRRLYEALRQWGQGNGNVTIIGGWAIVATVSPDAVVPSRDIDLVFRTPESLTEFQQQAPGWKLEPRLDKQDQRIVYAHTEDTTGTIVVDVFTTGDWGRRHFPSGTNVLRKDVPFTGLFPPLEWLLAEKLETIPSRMGQDAQEKQEKDLLDIHRLVFHNREGATPLELLAIAGKGRRREALSRIERAIRNHPGFAADYRKIAQWLAR